MASTIEANWAACPKRGISLKDHVKALLIQSLIDAVSFRQGGLDKIPPCGANWSGLSWNSTRRHDDQVVEDAVTEDAIKNADAFAKLRKPVKVSTPAISWRTRKTRRGN